MSRLDRKRLHEENFKKQREGTLIDPYANFEGNKLELAFIKFFKKLSQNRMRVYIGLLIVAICGATVISVLEYLEYREGKATRAVEELEKKHSMNPGLDLNKKISDYETLKKDQASGSVHLRLSKVLSDMYARNGEFAKAAETLEKTGSKINNPKEIKAFYFYIAANYRERAGDLKTALQNYNVVSGLLNKPKDLPSFSAWAYYQTGRLKLLNGDKEGAVKEFKKVLDIESSEQQESFLTARELSSYQLIKLSQG